MKRGRQAALPGLAALMVALGAGQAHATHEGWSGYQSQNPQGWSQPAPWWQQQPVQRQQPWPSRRGSGYSNWSSWFSPPAYQNIEPEPEPVKPPPIYTYKADPLVVLGDPELQRPAGWAAFSDRGRDTPRRTGSEQARTIFDVLKSGTAGVEVTDEQRQAIIAFYREREFAPVWTAADAEQRTRDLLSRLEDAAAEGLEPGDYLPPEMMTFSDDLGGLDAERRARVELGLTAAALRYAMHASGGRIDPNRISGYHDLKPPTVDPGEALKRLAQEPQPAAYLASLHPVHPAYSAFQQALAELRSSDLEGVEPIADGGLIRPGEADERVPAIRSRLAKMGHLAPAPRLTQIEDPDLDVTTEVAVEGPLFGNAEELITVAPGPESRPVAEPESRVLDEDLVAAVKALQRAAGLSVDGVVGPRTLAALNADSPQKRLETIVYNMERLRWLPRDFGTKHVFVNQAAFEAQVVEDGETIWRTKVIVGKPNNQTAFFSDQMETVVFNPYWGVPGSIIINEMLPEIYRDPSWLDREGYEVTDLNGNVISSYSVDWYSINKNNIPIGVRQPPGPKNALGQLKFLFPNEHAIYMHDTPSKSLFDKDVRAFSHGCVRVQDPRRFAEIILGWDQERIASEIASTRNRSVPVEPNVPVHVAYFTAWPDENGGVRYFSDVYDRDKLLERAFGTLVVAMR